MHKKSENFKRNEENAVLIATGDEALCDLRAASLMVYGHERGTRSDYSGIRRGNLLKLGLGTVQFGMDYGVSNNQGMTSLNEAKAILHFAWENGIELIETAYSYGDSESVLGMALTDKHGFRIITKTPVYNKISIGLADAESLEIAFHDSLRRSGQKKFAGLLIHNADDLLVAGGEMLFSAMQNLKKNGLTEKIGVSVYSGEQINSLLEQYAFDIIQVPINVLDQRLILSGHLAKLKEKGIEIHARSAFLQGLLLMDPASLHSFFDPIKPLLYKYRDFLFENGLTCIEGTLGFIKQFQEIDYIIIGVNNLEQLKINIKSFAEFYGGDSISDRFKVFSLNNPIYLNPGLWKINK